MVITTASVVRGKSRVMVALDFVIVPADAPAVPKYRHARFGATCRSRWPLLCDHRPRIFSLLQIRRCSVRLTDSGTPNADLPAFAASNADLRFDAAARNERLHRAGRNLIGPLVLHTRGNATGIPQSHSFASDGHDQSQEHEPRAEARRPRDEGKSGKWQI